VDGNHRNAMVMVSLLVGSGHRVGTVGTPRVAMMRINLMS
jgi:hypothetical protein